jgi:hypothetical protein
MVLQCRRDELAVLYRHRRTKRHDPSPLVGALLIEGKDARTVAEHERSEPCFETGSTLKASHALFLDAPPDLSERDNAQEQIG